MEIKRKDFLKVTSLAGFGFMGLKSASGTAIQSQKNYNIKDYGAKEGTQAINTESIQKAINAAHEAGGGRVVVPSGTFATGTLILKSNVEIHLQEKAELLGSPKIKDYSPQKPTERRGYDGTEPTPRLTTSLIFAQGAHDISITGAGILNGNNTSDANDFMQSEKHERPGIIWFDECTNVFVQGVTFTEAGFWIETYSMCRNLHIDGIKVRDSYFPSNDGCNIVDCENALIENCDIKSQDDAIVLKSFTLRGCRNIIVRNNRVRSLTNGFKIGTETNGPFENILIEKNTVWETGISGIAIESVDGSVLSNIIVRDIQMDVVSTPIFIRLGNRRRGTIVDGKEKRLEAGGMQNIHISNIRATVDKYEFKKDIPPEFQPYASSITGFPGHYPTGITIEDVEIEILGGFPVRGPEDANREVPLNSDGYPENRMFGVLPAYGFYVRHVKDMRMANVNVRIRQEDSRPAFVLDEVHDAIFQNISTNSITNTDKFKVKDNCTEIEILPD